MFEIAITMLTELIHVIPTFACVVLVFNLISDLLFNK